MKDSNQSSSLSQDLIEGARTITIKVGSSLLIDADQLRRNWIAALAEDIANFRNAGKRVLVVTSGAVALGSAHLALRRSGKLALKQAAAAAGQPLLMDAWAAAFQPFGIRIAQLLLTIDDTESRRRWLNARATIDVLLKVGAVPMINENDSVATEELRYGDNDRLSARVAQMVKSDVLILLSDVDGLYSADPRRDPNARHLPHVERITEEIEACAGGASVGGIGSGGMRTKIVAARIASGFGCATIIASGRPDHPLCALASAQTRSTVIDAVGSPRRAYKQWIAGALSPAGKVMVDDGALKALRAGKSLLPSGVRMVEGTFERGACLSVIAPGGGEVARGIVAYNSQETRAIIGSPTSDIETRLGYRGPDELIHRDDLVLL